MEIQVIGDAYKFDLKNGVVVEIERLAEESGGLTGEITIADHAAPSTRLLHSARLNLMSTQSRNSLCKSLEKVRDNIDWYAKLEYICFLAKETYRKGQGAIDLAQVGCRPTSRWLLHPFVECGAPTVIYGNGGSAKSTLALAMGLTVASGKHIMGDPVGPPVKVLMLDWESDEYEHKERMLALCQAADVPLPQGQFFYMHMAVSLSQAAQNIKRRVAEQGIGLLVVDSLGAAKGGEPESADASLKAFGALRSIGVASLCVDHVSGAVASGASTFDKPYGSVYTHNSARITWKIDKVQEPGEGELCVSFTHTKCNHGRLLDKMVYQLNYIETEDADRTVEYLYIKKKNIEDVPEFVQKLSVPQQVMLAMKHGDYTNKGLADELGVDVKKIKPITSRFHNTGRLVGRKNADGAFIYALNAVLSE